MRHIGTVIAAVIVGPLAWILFALGQDRSAQAFADAQGGGTLDGGDFVRPALVLAAAGILLGLIATLRFSPLGAALTGLFYSATYLGLLVSPTAVLGLLDHEPTLAGYQVDLAAPLRTGTTLLVGSLMLVAVVSVRRWQRWPQPAAEAPEALQPDEVIPPAAQQDRPLGADGLGLSTPTRKPEPELARAGGSDGAGRSSGTGASDWADRSDWAGSLSGGSGDRPGRSSDWPRQPSR
ncbi:hypothetical protein GA0074695_6116 [Micromonospora viridifaciens]|uniref:Tryptophan-associated transmembrane protein (Trp_oprn_chp) n=1 Tax=Micromonospora viridifaciens TaxID=1881 RepID=A0A1C4ZTY5_MICVI|nr:hypothetical protein [Micromonospora viridifaciens]SCF36405.1 hypothetical protein GA0074695_6116 [Micromonospora viridifaciens]